MRAQRDDGSTSLVTAALLAVVVALVGLAGAVKLARSAVDFGPAVGDIIAFDPNGSLPRDLRTQIDADRVGQAGCVLDLEAIHRDGGSLIVEQRLRGDNKSRYRVHWAGRYSSGGPNDCGKDADLTLDDSNLDLLAMAAGGWGVGRKHLAPNALWNTSAGGSRVQ